MSVPIMLSAIYDPKASEWALLSSCAGFAADGKLVRGWELKLLWFNSLCALLTTASGVLLIVGSRKAIIAWAGAAALGAFAIVAFVQQTFDHVRDDGVIEKVSTGSNVAFWGGLA